LPRVGLSPNRDIPESGLITMARPSELEADGGWSIATAGANRLWQAPLACLSPPGRRGRLTVLMFHRVRSEPDPLYPDEPTPMSFRQRLLWVRDWFNVLPLDRAVTLLTSAKLPARAAAITFDDGYADNATVAAPILKELGLHATFFVASGFLDGGRMWNDTLIEAIRRCAATSLDLTGVGLGRCDLATIDMRRAAIEVLIRALKHLPPDERQRRVDAVASAARADLPDSLMMTSAELRRVAAMGMGIGAHTIHHPILATLSDRAASDEIAGSREQLEGIVRQPVTLFAYPNGRPGADYRKRDAELARASGFDASFTTSPGASRMGDPLHELPRFTPWNRGRTAWALRFLQNFRMPVQRAAT
jgi:peptidoglycan/xylan/chitin deacetylase (PgdA/CDA1 family)